MPWQWPWRRAEEPAAVKRSGYTGAVQSRLTADWVMSSLNADSEIRQSLRTLRFRMRELERNDDYVRSYLGLLVTNVVGANGYSLQMQVRDEATNRPDGIANDQIEAAWQAWCRVGICTMDGRSSFRDVAAQFVRTVARDGEVLTRFVRGKAAGNKFGFSIQLVEADHLDENDVRTLGNGNRVKMGVEVNAWNRPVAYHLTSEHPGEMLLTGRRLETIRVPASDCLHSFMAERAGQSRGIPWMASAMLRLRMLGGYEEAELVASRVSAAKMGFFEDAEGAAEGLTDDKDADGNMIIDAQAGQFQRLPHGVTFKPWDPQHPNAAFGAFIKAMLRGTAASVGVSYNSIAGDLEGVNFSSLRHGVLNERDLWRVLQAWQVESWLRSVFEAWLEMSLTSGAIGQLPFRKFEKFNRPRFQPRGWQWIDPLKDVNANIAALEAGLTTRTSILAAQGLDYEDVVRQLAREREIAEAAGIALSAGTFAPDGGAPQDEEN